VYGNFKENKKAEILSWNGWQWASKIYGIDPIKLSDIIALKPVTPSNVMKIQKKYLLWRRNNNKQARNTNIKTIKLQNSSNSGRYKHMGAERKDLIALGEGKKNYPEILAYLEKWYQFTENG
jgi:hypothetical protein